MAGILRGGATGYISEDGDDDDGGGVCGEGDGGGAECTIGIVR